MKEENTNKELSPHFTLREMTISATAIRNGWDNTPMIHEVENLRALCANVLEPLRRRFGVIRITSGYRSRKLNRAVGGVKDSQHIFGEAADIYVPNLEMGRRMHEFLVRNVVFDQLIFEVDHDLRRMWIHVSYRREGNNRMMAIMNYRLWK